MPKEQTIKKSALAPTVLIAGGTGFIGLHLAEALLLKDARVIVVDTITPNKDLYVKPLLQNPKFALFDCDINKQIPPEIQSVDYIVNLAGVEHKAEVTLDSLLTNTSGAKNLLDLAHKSGAKFLLVSSTDVYQGAISPIGLEHYFGQTEEEEKKYSLSEARRFAEALVWEYYKKHGTDVRIVRLPQVYGPRMSFDSSGSLGRFLKELTERQNLTIFGDGTEKEYYLYIADAVSGLIKALFGEKSEGKIYTLVHKEASAVLETAYLLKSIADGEVQVVFKPKTQKGNLQPANPDRTTLGELGWEPKIGLKEGIVKTLKWVGYEINTYSFKPTKLIEKKLSEKRPIGAGVDSIAKPVQLIKEQVTGITSIASVSKEKNTEIKKALYLTGVFVLSLFLIFTVTPAMQTAMHTKVAIDKLTEVPSLITQLEAQAAWESANGAFQDLVKAQRAFTKLAWVFGAVGKKDMYNSAKEVLSSATYFSKTLYKVSKASGPFVSLWDVIRPQSTSTLDPAEIANTRVEIDSAYKSLQMAQADFKQVNVNVLPSRLAQTAKRYGEALAQTAKTLELADALAADLPTLLGANSPKRYLVLFQNSNEIRPTGGFIGSYAFVELDKGKIVNLTIDDVYNPDGQIDLRKITEPVPSPIEKHLGETAMHIRNANWRPNFPESADAIRDLFFKVDGKNIDGVIALDLDLAQRLLGVVGPTFLTAYNEEITADNLYERVQFHSEFNYTNGSDQKKSFLTLLGSKLLEKIFALPNKDLPKLFAQIHGALEEKHLLVYLPKTTFSAFLKEAAWDGGLAQTQGDYLYVVNANLGGTKANYYVKQNMHYEIAAKTRDGLLRATLTLNYDHTGKDTAWPGGPYVNYVRVLTQNGTKLTGAKLMVGGKPEDIFAKMVISTESGHPSYETDFTLLPQEKAQLVLEYDLPQNLSITALNKNYALYWQKQPGTQDDAFSVTFSPPFGMKVVGTAPAAAFVGDTVSFEGELNTDRDFAISIN